MKKNLFKRLYLGICSLLLISVVGSAQAVLFEWRLTNATYNSTDPDGAGPAQGSATFTMQVRAISSTVNVSTITIGWSWQDANAMLPVPVACLSGATPGNVAISSAFTGWAYTTVQQCNILNPVINTGGQDFDRRVAGTFESAVELPITTTWTDMFTVTLWSKNSTDPFAGYVMLNSGVNGTPGPLGTYALSNIAGDEFGANSLSYTTPLALRPGTLPVLFTDYKVNCGDNGTLISWRTASEENSSHYVIEKNTNGSWKAVDQVAAAGNSSVDRDYRYIDLEGGIAQYRIKQVDKDGQFTYTAISYATCEDKKVKVFIYPVPARDVLNVAIRTEKALRTNLEVFDMSGRMVARQATVLNSGNNNITMNVGHLASGEYVIRSSDGTIQLNKKFTIVH